MSFDHLFVINKNISILTMGRDVTKLVEHIVTYIFLSFVSQVEHIVNKVILLKCATELIVWVNYLCVIFFPQIFENRASR